LEDYSQKYAKSDVKGILYLDKFTEFLKDHYAATSETLKVLLKYKEITFQLFSIFFRFQLLVFMIFSSSEQPECFIFDSEEVKSVNGEKTFEMYYYYLIYDGKSFAKIITMIRILEFRDVRKIISLVVYFFYYHAIKEKIMEELVQRGRKYIDFIGVHYRNYKG
jgi:hypothetical protein